MQIVCILHRNPIVLVRSAHSMELPPEYHANSRHIPELSALNVNEDVGDDFTSESDIELWSDSHESDEDLYGGNDHNGKPLPPGEMVVPPEAIEPPQPDDAVLPSYEESQALQDPFRAAITRAFNPGDETSDSKKLSHPILIPQRRAKAGFVRVFAPALAGCGISQLLFHRFLKDFHKSSQAHPAYSRVQISSTVDELTSVVIAQAVCVQERIGVSRRTYTDRFLKAANQTLFEPLGLHAMVVRFVAAADLDGGLVCSEVGDHRVLRATKATRRIAGDSKRPTGYIQSAPLRSLDRNGTVIGQSFTALGGAALPDAKDMCAQASIARAQTSNLTKAQSKQARRAERLEHRIDKIALRHERRVAKGCEPKDSVQTSKVGPSRALDRSPGGGKLYREDEEGTIVYRAIREGVLYLLVVNMPLQSELAKAQSDLARARPPGV